MKDFFGKCGCNCGHCPAFKANVKTKKDRERCRDGWNKYLGTTIRKFDWIYCSGCQSADPWKLGNLLPDRTCNLRPCAIKLGVKNCAYCSKYPCKDLTGRIPSKDFRKEVESRLGAPVPQQDYLNFIEPYEGVVHLKKIRASLKKKDVVKMPKIPPLKANLLEFPHDLPFSKNEISAFKLLHTLLTDFITARAKTYARQILMKRRRQLMVSILWIFGYYGDLKKKGGAQLIVDGSKIGSLFIIRKYDNTLYSAAAHCFRMLNEYGIHGEFVSLKKSWQLKVSFSKKNGVDALKSLKQYATTLVKKYGVPKYAGSSRYKGRAFTLFSKADMRILKKGVVV